MLLLITNSSFGAWTAIINSSEKADKSSAALMAKTKDVRVSDIINLSEPLMSSGEFEKLVKKSKKAKNLKIDSIMHGNNFFYLHAGPIRVVFKWIDKENIAYKINGHSFTYKEAARTELWQKKIIEVVKKYQGEGQAFTPQEAEFFRISYESSLGSSYFLNLGRTMSSMLIMPLFFQANLASAFQIDWGSKWTWTAIGVAVVALVANHIYRNHKKEHKSKKSKITSRLSSARTNLKAAQDRGEVNLSSYQKEVFDLENLQAEYEQSSDVGFFGFLFGSRMKEPSMYRTIMSRPGVETGTTGTGVPGAPTAPPTFTPKSSSEGTF